MSADGYPFYRSQTMQADLEVSPAARENWQRMAVQWLRVMLVRGALVRFIADDVYAMWYKQDMPPPQDKRNWGTVFQRAKSEGLIKQFGVLGVPQTAVSPSRHRSVVWCAA